MDLKTETFRQEIETAMESYDRHIVCLPKTPDECLDAIKRLILKAIKAYKNRAEGMRHGIALDKEITIMLSQSDEERPFCAIYFNLHSPYNREDGGRNIVNSQPGAENIPPN